MLSGHLIGGGNEKLQITPHHPPEVEVHALLSQRKKRVEDGRRRFEYLIQEGGVDAGAGQLAEIDARVYALREKADLDGAKQFLGLREPAQQIVEVLRGLTLVALPPPPVLEEPTVAFPRENLVQKRAVAA